MKTSVLLGILFAGAMASADVPRFEGIDQAELENIIEEFGVGLSHTSVSPASSLGTLFGVEAGLIMGAVTSESIEQLVAQVQSTVKVDKLPHAALYAALSIPFGLTAEASFVPKTTLEDLEFKKTGLALKWTVTETLLSFIPIVDIAVKGHFTQAELNYAQTINNASTANTNVTADVGFDSSIKGLQLVVSGDLFMLEPYVGYGMVEVDGEIEVTSGVSGGTIFDPSFTTGTSAKKTASGSEYFAGVQFNLLLLRIGAEYGKILDNEKYSAKLSLKF